MHRTQFVVCVAIPLLKLSPVLMPEMVVMLKVTGESRIIYDSDATRPLPPLFLANTSTTF
jgi:hypothetical protein